MLNRALTEIRGKTARLDILASIKRPGSAGTKISAKHYRQQYSSFNCLSTSTCLCIQTWIIRPLLLGLQRKIILNDIKSIKFLPFKSASHEHIGTRVMARTQTYKRKIGYYNT
jgi:hypothetical protein